METPTEPHATHARREESWESRPIRVRGNEDGLVHEYWAQCSWKTAHSVPDDEPLTCLSCISGLSHVT